MLAGTSACGERLRQKSGHQLPLAALARMTASDGEQPLGGRGSVAVTGQKRTNRLDSEIGAKRTFRLRRGSWCERTFERRITIDLAPVFVGEKCGKLAEQRVDAADTIDARLVVDLESGMIALDKPPATIKWE